VISPISLVIFEGPGIFSDWGGVKIELACALLVDQQGMSGNNAHTCCAHRFIGSWHKNFTADFILAEKACSDIRKILNPTLDLINQVGQSLRIHSIPVFKCMEYKTISC